MSVTEITTPSGHTIIPGKFTVCQEPATILVPLTQAQLAALCELEEPEEVEEGSAEDGAFAALWGALTAMDEHVGAVL